MDKELSVNAKQRILNIQMVQASFAFLGGIGGVVYSNKTGGGFWRGVGYWIVGSVAVGVVGKLIALPFENKIIKDDA